MSRNLSGIRRKSQTKYPRISTDMFPVVKPDFKKLEGSKEEIILNWLRSWIKDNLASGLIKENDLLPVKADLAYYFGAGEGTVQNAIRKLEDEHVVVSKQRIGTMIVQNVEAASLEKLTSKRDKIAQQIKAYIASNNLKQGDILPTMKELERILNSKRNSVRAALDYLVFKGIIKSLDDNEDNKLWQVVQEVKDVEILENIDEITSDTLAQKIAVQIEEYITANLKVGDRIDAISVWAKRFNVSEKTTYDAMHNLFDKGVIKARRGRYGTIVVQMPNTGAFEPAKEMSIFMPAEQAAIYSYQRIENFIRNKIKNEYSIGQKLPSMKELSLEMDVSTNTIRKAMVRLSAEGYVNLQRGRFGGIYVADIPEEETGAFKWLAVNPQYVKSYKN